MSARTKIEWADYTFNPWVGCAKVSPGCTNCYAERQMDTRLGRARWGTTGTRVLTSPANWRKPFAWDRQAAAERVPRRVFCASLADVFEDMEQLEPWRADLWRLIDGTPHLIWMLLTKRPENIRKMFPHYWPNVWLGTSIERQPEADLRIPELLKCQAAVRFLSYEPALGPVDFTRIDYTPELIATLREFAASRGRDPEEAVRGYGPGAAWIDALSGEWCDGEDYGKEKERLHWVIVGGESGPKARPCDVEWIRSVMDQCRAAGVPVFVKQLGRWPSSNQPESLSSWEPLFADKACTKLSGRYAPPGGLPHKGGDPLAWPDDLRVREIPKGRE